MGPVGVERPLDESCRVGYSCLDESCLVCTGVEGVELRWASRLFEKLDMNEKTVNIAPVSTSLASIDPTAASD